MHVTNTQATPKIPPAQVHRTESRFTKQVRRELENIVFREADARWFHHPHADALVITARVANNNIHRLMVDDGSAVDIIYLNAYKRMGLTKNDLDPNILIIIFVFAHKKFKF